MKDRDTARIEVMPLDSADATTLQGFVHERTKPDTMVITDEALAYNRGASAAPRLKHGVNEFVNGMIHTNGMELLRAMLKRTYVGAYSHMGATHPGRTSNGFAGRRNVGPVGTEFQMGALVQVLLASGSFTVTRSVRSRHVVPR